MAAQLLSWRLVRFWDWTRTCWSFGQFLRLRLTSLGQHVAGESTSLVTWTDPDKSCTTTDLVRALLPTLVVSFDQVPRCHPSQMMSVLGQGDLSC